MLAIDSGFSTQKVYAWIRNQSIHNVMASKGIDNSLVPLNAPTRVDVNIRGKKITNGVRLWKIGVSILKSEFYGWLNKPEAWRENFLRKEESTKQTPPGGQSTPAGAPCCHFPEYATEYFKQITAEQLVTRIVKGYPKREWQKTRDRNEALDCRIYARAAAIALGIDRWSEQRWKQISDIQSAGNQSTNYYVPKTRKKVIKSNWM